MILLAGDVNRHPFTERLVQFAKANGTSLRVVASRRISSGPFEFTVTLLDREP